MMITRQADGDSMAKSFNTNIGQNNVE